MVGTAKGRTPKFAPTQYREEMMLLYLFVKYHRVKRHLKQAISGDVVKARFAESEAYDHFVDEIKSAQFWAFRKA